MRAEDELAGCLGDFLLSVGLGDSLLCCESLGERLAWDGLGDLLDSVSLGELFAWESLGERLASDALGDFFVFDGLGDRLLARFRATLS